MPGSLDDILKYEELFPIASSESEEEENHVSDSASIFSSSLPLSSTSSNQAIFIDKVLTSEMSPPP